MTLSVALNNALSGLNINQRQLAVLSQNISNANTAGYSRQVLNQSALSVNGVGQGVIAESVTRKIDEYMQRSVQNQTANVGAASTMNDYYSRMQILLGTPGSGNGLDSYVNNFFTNIQSLSQTPELVSRQQSAVSSATALANQVSSLANETQKLRYEADYDIGNGVKYVNQQLQSLYNVNVAINRAATLGTSTASLLDDRDKLINNISQYIDVSTSFRTNGEVSLATSNGTPLLDQSLYQLQYSAAPSVDSFKNDSPLSALQVFRLDLAGNPVGNPSILVSGGTSGQVVSTLKSGSLKALVELRDKTFTGVLSQLDSIASQVRDQVNAIHNKGSGWPAPQSLTGTRLVSGTSVSTWTGTVQIALLQPDGNPIPSAYANESGVMPLNLDLSKLNSGAGEGRVTVQSIVDEINSAFTPQNKAHVGNLNNIRIASNSAALPGTPPLFNFDFDLENLSGSASTFFVNGVTVQDDTGTTLSGTSMNVPSVALAGANTFVTQTGANSNVVTVNTAVPHGLVEGQRVYLNNPGVVPDVNGIPNSAFQGYFIATNVTGTSFDITVAGNATTAGGVAATGQSAITAYDQVEKGTSGRTTDHGSITADLTGATGSRYYDITVNVAVDDNKGGFTTSTVTYRVLNNQANALNDRFSASSVAGGGSLVVPQTTQPYARAILVDGNGNELPKVNGAYIDKPGYLKIETLNSNYSVAINEQDSKEEGTPAQGVSGTNRGFSYYFELNNFFKSNQPTSTGDTLKNSALNLAIESRILNNPSLISLGTLVSSPQPGNLDAAPVYTVKRNSGDNQIINALAAVGTQSLQFNAAGGLPTTVQSLSNYTAQFLGFNAAQSASSTTTLASSQTLLDGFQQRAQAASGVNLDEELANTIIYQNAYSASARIISVAQELYDTLFNTF